MERREAIVVAGGVLSGVLAGCLDQEDETSASEIHSDNDVNEIDTSSSNSNSDDSSDDFSWEDATIDEDEDESDTSDLEEAIEEELDDDTDPVEEPDENDSDIPDTQTIVDDETTVGAGEYIWWETELYQDVEVELTTIVRSGQSTDIIFTSPDEFEEFRAGNRHLHYEEISQIDTIGDTTTGTLPEGSYYILIDNTMATGSVRVDVTLEISEP